MKIHHMLFQLQYLFNHVYFIIPHNNCFDFNNTMSHTVALELTSL